MRISDAVGGTSSWNEGGRARIRAGAVAVAVALGMSLLVGCSGGTTVAQQTTSTLSPELDDQFTTPDEPEVAITFCVENTTENPQLMDDALASLPKLVSTIAAPDREPPALDVDRPAVALSAQTMTTASFGAPFWSGVLPAVRSTDTVADELAESGDIEVDADGKPAGLKDQRAVESEAKKDRDDLKRAAEDLRAQLGASDGEDDDDEEASKPETDEPTDEHEIAGCAGSAASEFADYPDLDRRVLVFVSSGQVAKSQQIDDELLGRLAGVETYAVLACDEDEIDDLDICTRAKKAFRAFGGLSAADMVFFTDGDIESAFPDALGKLGS